jgi:hypothetical protein
MAIAEKAVKKQFECQKAMDDYKSWFVQNKNDVQKDVVKEELKENPAGKAFVDKSETLGQVFKSSWRTPSPRT